MHNDVGDADGGWTLPCGHLRDDDLGERVPGQYADDFVRVDFGGSIAAFFKVRCRHAPWPRTAGRGASGEISCQ